MSNKKWELQVNTNNTFTISRDGGMVFDGRQLYEGNENEIQLDKKWYSEFEMIVHSANDYANQNEFNFNWNLNDCDMTCGITIDFDGEFECDCIDLSELGDLRNLGDRVVIGLRNDEIELLKVLISCANSTEPIGKHWDMLISRH